MNEFRQCTKCNEIKLIDTFPKRKDSKDGFYKRCRNCINAGHRRYFHTTNGRESIMRSQRKYWASEKGKTMLKKAAKKYNQTAKGKENDRRKKLNGKERNKAEQAIYRAVRNKKMPKATQLGCENCKNKASEYHHYLGYSRNHRFSVIPLCKKCHTTAHHLPANII